MTEKIWSYCEGIPDPVDIPEISVVELFRQTAEKFPERNMTEFKGKYKSYPEIEEEINRFANSLKELGVGKGDRVACMMVNCPQYIIAFFATNSLGAIFTAISSLYTSKEIRYQLQDSEAKVIVTLDLFLDKIREVKDDTKIEHIIVSSVGDELPGITAFLYKKVIGRKNPKVKDELKYQDLLKKGENKRIKTKIDPKEDAAVFQYTGGTTGVMKGAMLTNYNLISQASILPYWDIYLPERPEGQYKISGCLPMSHIFGFSTSFLWTVATGGLLYLIPDPRQLEDVMASISKHGIHFMFAVPVLYQKIAEHPDIGKYDLSSLYMSISGGEALPLSTSEKFEAISDCILVEGYGLSESSPVTHINPPTAELKKVGSIGIPIPNTLAMIVDMDTQDEITEYGKEGELWIRSPGVMKGYWNNKEATDNSLVKGWLRTGDIATMDDKGYFAIVDRIKDMIIISGFKVWPSEVEDVLYTHPDINGVGVIQAKTETGEQVKAVLVAEPGSKELSLKEVRDYCKKSMAPYKVPSLIEYRDELPRSTVGKVLRKDLRAEDVITPPSQVKEEVKPKQ
ncbi:MAG: AMP-binding protein [Candidatus Heimdallarchaeota archaeon]|nr:AMP-binding protein [Candidatus Heimdallarchaeota archaeon]MCK4770904.1 AMP-binding protein [Candidatus Heimdallarchaeota archaeon]